MANYKLSPAAEEDLIEIYLRGITEWGVSKADEYQDRLIATFNHLAANPNIGREVEVRPKLRRHEVIPYIVFYGKEDYGVRIVRILYMNRAIERHL